MRTVLLELLRLAGVVLLFYAVYATCPPYAGAATVTPIQAQYADGPRVTGAAITAAANSCVCEYYAGLCRTAPTAGPNLPLRRYIHGAACGAPDGARITGMTYLSDMLGVVRTVIIEWSNP